MEALAAALRAYGLALCAAITSCRDLHSLLTLLALAAADLLCEEQPAQPSNDVPEAPGEQELAARRRSLAAAAAEAAATSEQRRALFYASSAYQDVAETLLTGAPFNICRQLHSGARPSALPDFHGRRPSRSPPCRSRGARLAAALHPRAAPRPV